MKNKHKVIIIVVLLVGSLLGYQKLYAQPQSVKKLVTTTVKRGDLKEELTISGKIDAQEHVTLRFQTSGLLSWVGVKEGDLVKKYQGIASLDQRELQKNLQKYLETYKKERNDFEDSKDTYKSAVITDGIKRILQNSQSDLNSSVIDVEIKDLALKFSNLWTPIAGVMTKVSSAYPGVNVTPSQAEFEVVNPETVYFLALADQTEVVKLKENMPGTLVLDAFSKKEIPGTIKTLSFVPESGETSTVYAVKFVFDNPDPVYRLGMTGDASFVLQKKENVLYLPKNFIKTKNGKKYVGDILVTIGMETETSVEITSGLSEGQTVTLENGAVPSPTTSSPFNTFRGGFGARR